MTTYRRRRADECQNCGVSLVARCTGDQYVCQPCAQQLLEEERCDVPWESDSDEEEDDINVETR